MAKWENVAQWCCISPNSTEWSRGIHMHHPWLNSLGHSDSVTVCRVRWDCMSVSLFHSLVDLIFSHIWGQVLSESHTNILACLDPPLTCTVNFILHQTYQVTRLRRLGPYFPRPTCLPANCVPKPAFKDNPLAALFRCLHYLQATK